MAQRHKKTPRAAATEDDTSGNRIIFGPNTHAMAYIDIPKESWDQLFKLLNSSPLEPILLKKIQDILLTRSIDGKNGYICLDMEAQHECDRLLKSISSDKNVAQFRAILHDCSRKGLWLLGIENGYQYEAGMIEHLFSWLIIILVIGCIAFGIVSALLGSGPLMG